MLKKICLSVTLVGISSTLAAETAVPPAPEVFFAYGRIYDEACANGFGLANSEIASARLNPAWAAEIKERLPEFQRMWRQEGLLFVEELLRSFRKAFARKEFTASLSACRATPSMGTPLILNVTHALKSYMGDRPTSTPSEFSVLVFHELLHVWLTDNLPSSTPSLKKYAQESLQTQNHLHLIAIQKYLLRKFKRPDLLEYMKSDYAKMGGGHKRAWDIVEVEESALIQELRNL